jgi:heme exporter protein A
LISGLSLEELALTRGDRALFSGFNLRLERGQAVALTGANGAGKTSLIRAVAGLLRPAHGRVRFLDGETEVEAADVRAHGLHLLGHHDGLKSARRAWDELLFQVRWTGGTLADAERARERLKLGPLLNLEIRKLSAGQRRRVALARLMASPRPLWLLDEPFAPLDAERRAVFGELMSEHLAGGGMILAAVHDPLPIAARAVEVGA